MSARAYELAIKEAKEHDWWKSGAEDAVVSAFMICQEHNMSILVAQEMIWGLVAAMREEYGD